jgi:hypothetical protein
MYIWNTTPSLRHWNTRSDPQAQLRIKIFVQRSLVFRVINMWIYFRFRIVTPCCSGTIFRRFRDAVSQPPEVEIFLQVNIERLDGKITQNAVYLFRNKTVNCFLPAAGFILFKAVNYEPSVRQTIHILFTSAVRELWTTVTFWANGKESRGSILIS